MTTGTEGLFHCRICLSLQRFPLTASRGAPKRWPKYRTPARVRHCIVRSALFFSSDVKKNPDCEQQGLEESIPCGLRVLTRCSWPRRGRPLFLWHFATTCLGSPRANHIKASQPHCPRFPPPHFLVFALWSLFRPLFFWAERIFRVFPVSGSNR